MDKLKFCFEKPSEEADFMISYKYCQWNDYGYREIYKITALPHLTEKEENLMLGCMTIIADPKTMKDDTEQKDVLRLLLKEETAFEKLPEGCLSRLYDEDMAKKLFVLLSPEQRKDFSKSLGLCLTPEQCQENTNWFSNHILFRTVFERNGGATPEAWKEMDEKQLEPVRRYLMSEIDYKTLPTL